MAIVAPFMGMTYNYHLRQDFGVMVSPPYDVISEEEQEAYYRADPYNVVRLILGKKKIGDTDWDNRYTRAADYFRRWESADILIREYRPCLYLTSHTYDPGGNGEKRRTRWGIVALVCIEEPDSGVVLPHERTFSAYRDDRLKLLRACGVQFSQIFGLYQDPENTILEAFKQALVFHPQIAFDFEDGTRHQLWILPDPMLANKLADFMKDKPIFIADGHHRYETSRNYRNIMRARYGRRPLNRSYEYVMMYLTNMNDEGLTILPSHRLIKVAPGFQLKSFLDKVKTWFEINAVPCSAPDIPTYCSALKERLFQDGRTNTVIAFHQHQSEQCYIFSLKPGAREEMGDDLHPALKKLDVLVLSRFILQKALGFNKEDLDNDEIFRYQSSMKTAVSEVNSGNFQMAFLLNPTKIDHVTEVATNALVMPRKSTYFFPKVLTGLVFNKIDPHEIIQVP